MMVYRHTSHVVTTQSHSALRTYEESALGTTADYLYCSTTTDTLTQREFYLRHYAILSEIENVYPSVIKRSNS